MSRQNTRLEALQLLIKAEGNIAELEQNLVGFEWDYDGDPVVLDKEAITNVLSRSSSCLLGMTGLFT